MHTTGDDPENVTDLIKYCTQQATISFAIREIIMDSRGAVCVVSFMFPRNS